MDKEVKGRSFEFELMDPAPGFFSLFLELEVDKLLERKQLPKGRGE